MSIREQFMNIRVFFNNMNYHELGTKWDMNYMLYRTTDNINL